MAIEKLKQDFAEGDFFLFASDHVGDISHGDAHRVSEPLFQRLGRSRPGNNVLARVNHQGRRFDVTEVGADIVTATRLHKAKVRLYATLERTPHTAASQELFAIGVVVVRFE